MNSQIYFDSTHVISKPHGKAGKDGGRSVDDGERFDIRFAFKPRSLDAAYAMCVSPPRDFASTHA